MKILKNIGEYEEYDRQKLRNSLLHASASTLVTNEIIDEVEKNIHEEMETSEIYNIAFNLLKNKEKATAIRYSVKRSIFDFGPTGFPFEKYIAEIFKAKGYKTQVGVVLKGHCVSHEVDVVAHNENELILLEVKFRNTISLKTGTKTALYIKARWDDLRGLEIDTDNNQRKKPTRFILATNTSFTDTAKIYAQCADLELISWEHPNKGNLYDLIKETRQHPITVLDELTNKQKENLLEAGFITLNQISKNSKILLDLGIKEDEKNRIIKELNEVCDIC